MSEIDSSNNLDHPEILQALFGPAHFEQFDPDILLDNIQFIMDCRSETDPKLLP